MLFAKFYDRLIKTNETNPETGLPIFKEVCFVEIRIKNNMTDIVDQPATEDKIRQFPTEYQHYLRAKQQIKDGTDLKVFAFLSPKEIASLNAHGIFTLESFIALEKQKVQDLQLEIEWQKAKDFIRLNKSGFDITSLEAEIATLKLENERLKERVSAFEAQMLSPTKPLKKRTKSTKGGINDTLQSAK